MDYFFICSQSPDYFLFPISWFILVPNLPIWNIIALRIGRFVTRTNNSGYNCFFNFFYYFLHGLFFYLFPISWLFLVPNLLIYTCSQSPDWEHNCVTNREIRNENKVSKAQRILFWKFLTSSLWVFEVIPLFSDSLPSLG